MSVFRQSLRLKMILAAGLLLALAAAFSNPAPAAAAPVAPTITSAEVQPDQTTIRLQWRHTGQSLHSYEIFYRPLGSSSWLWSSSSSVGAAHGSYVPIVAGQSTYVRDFRATGLTPGRSYEVTVKALESSGCPCSNPDTSKVTVVMNPPLTGVTATSSGTSITLKWAPYSAKPFAAFDLYLSAGTGSPSWVALETSPTATSHTFTGLTPGQTYSVGVRATQTRVQPTGGAPVKWAMTTQAMKTVQVAARCPASNERFCAVYPNAFVTTDKSLPTRINGVNLKRSVFRNPAGTWQTPYVAQEIAALGRTGAPAFNTVRIAMDWAYFQKKSGTAVVIDTGAFGQLDILIDSAINQGLNVILDPIHISQPAQTNVCPSNPALPGEAAMRGAHRNIPAWAWQQVGLTPGMTCENGTAWNNKVDDVLALQSTADYLRYILNRYDGDTARGKHVIAIDLVNEPNADGTTAKIQNERLRDAVYVPWLSATGPKSLRAVDPDKILVLEGIAGNTSLQGLNLAPIAKPNVVFSIHDYFTGALGTNIGQGYGMSSSGWPTRIEHGDVGSPFPYQPTIQSYAMRSSEHRTYVQQFITWLDPYKLPLYVGEYGIYSPCGDKTTALAATRLPWPTQYAADTYVLYESLSVKVNGVSTPVVLPRTYWTHGHWDAMGLWWRDSYACGTTKPQSYFPYAKKLTGNVTRP